MSTATNDIPSTSGGKLTAKGRATRERIVDAASRLMFEQGVERTTIEDIQDSAKVSASQLYHYFADKGSLVLAVVEHQTDELLTVQRSVLDRLDSFAALEEWRDLMVESLREQNCVGGCPIGSLASEMAESNPIARGALKNSFARWEELLRTGLCEMQNRGELGREANTDELALALLATVQGGLLLSQTRRDTIALEVAVNTSIAHLRTLAPRA